MAAFRMYKVGKLGMWLKHSQAGHGAPAAETKLELPPHVTFCGDCAHQAAADMPTSEPVHRA